MSDNNRHSKSAIQTSELATLVPSESLPAVQLFTDGACSGNPGPGGWAFILRHPKTGKVLALAEYGEGQATKALYPAASVFKTSSTSFGTADRCVRCSCAWATLNVPRRRPS